MIVQVEKFMRKWNMVPEGGSTCSQYALEALQKYGPLKGSYLAIRRILRCNHFHKGGYDPVP